MSELPNGWVAATLGGILELKYGKSLPEKTRIPGGVNVYGSNGIVGTHTSGVTAAPVIILGRKGSIGEAHFSEEPCFPIDTTYFVDEFECIEPRLAWHLFRFLPLRELNRASAIPGLNREDVYALPLALPPLSEQQRIVAKIDNLTGRSTRARNHLDHIPSLVEKYKEAILAAAFRGDLTHEWREKQGLPNPRSVLLGDVAEGFNYGSAAKSSKEGRVPVLRMGNIQGGKLDWADLVFTDDTAEITKYGLKEGDVLFNRTNSPALVGKTALFGGEREAIYAGYLIRVRCKPELLPAFLTYCLNAPNGRAYSWAVKTDGVSQSNINAKKLAAFRFDLPSTEEQAEIVRRIETALSWINRITVNSTNARKLINHLDQSFLAKAFKGELVPQDPTDEPASALLERIWAERVTVPKAKRGHKKAA
ncbi:restriction endonuclease subunit S [Achromobacter xylosoxidans]|uniref:restriction endonuclease subunit S n=1 Tax=Alcaligenes xylosoxydans xylosoxydans TaxID=85698 RepID=UPI0022B91C20|nr:restriction endonuclease subunit S [Achromobacter xylosoxidans]MCZ8437239.1 restriction endonuclease subunit S [Achromobacter xylosoxidans]